MVTTIRVPDKLHQEIKKEAEKKGLTLNAYLLGILWETTEKKRENVEKTYHQNLP